ncbi:XdhC family protein [Microbacterium sp. 18062]|uniref:XdhC family protein n=1 Tax=Microbacterium sp. 18062 TaxID=2681410 RepID=UPI001359E886|nr:XdhC/CoxI family protein [Microbacterium sp. 18062]
MLELAHDLLPLLRTGETVATVTVAHVARSAPRGVGSAMAVTRSARVIGSISGGCVEADAVALSLAALGRGDGTAARFGFSDEQAFAAGLACGGSIDAIVSVVRPDDDIAVRALERAADGRRSAIGIVRSGPRTGAVVEVPADTTESRLLAGAYDGDDLLVVAATPPPRLILLGAGEHAAALCRVGAAAGFTVSVCDVWELLVTRERFPAADDLVADTPHDYLARLDPEEIDSRTAVCVLTHDVRLDIPAIRVALGLPIGFVGALGARSTVARRAELLRAEGMTDADLARLHSPLGLDLGGASPEETALAVLAEIVAAHHGGSGRPLRELSGPLHRRVAEAEPVSAAAASVSCST